MSSVVPFVSSRTILALEHRNGSEKDEIAVLFRQRALEYCKGAWELVCGSWEACVMYGDGAVMPSKMGTQKELKWLEACLSVGIAVTRMVRKGGKGEGMLVICC